ncbi:MULTISPECIES: cupin domain-containing protein [Acetobacter]|uniref:cupin domain-containing protein n=1 Tax=Acetobacter TaxID=434 RepID=UPI001C0553E0|nr:MULTISPECIES: cupin domain-containing protein [Acetobacter]MCP1269957.1 cupin domain-containing protein [Acetobacter cerevisiae]MCP1277844.1 cupin domain-containing protein [Acetobacter cerevisiae]
MFHYNLEQVAATLSVLHLNQQTDDFAAKSMTTLFAFGQHNIGMVRFEGSTPWEEHPHDEFLLVVEGQTTVVLKKDGEELTLVGKKGDVLFVPGGSWHRQDTQGPVALLYITDKSGTQHTAKTPA